MWNPSAIQGYLADVSLWMKLMRRLGSAKGKRPAKMNACFFLGFAAAIPCCIAGRWWRWLGAHSERGDDRLTAVVRDHQAHHTGKEARPSSGRSNPGRRLPATAQGIKDPFIVAPFAQEEDAGWRALAAEAAVTPVAARSIRCVKNWKNTRQGSLR